MIKKKIKIFHLDEIGLMFIHPMPYKGFNSGDTHGWCKGMTRILIHQFVPRLIFFILIWLFFCFLALSPDRNYSVRRIRIINIDFYDFFFTFLISFPLNNLQSVPVSSLFLRSERTRNQFIEQWRVIQSKNIKFKIRAFVIY